MDKTSNRDCVSDGVVAIYHASRSTFDAIHFYNL